MDRKFAKVVMNAGQQVLTNYFRSRKRPRTAYGGTARRRGGHYKMRRGHFTRARTRRQREWNRSNQNRRDMKKVKCFINQRTAVHIHRHRRVGSVKVNSVNNSAYQEFTCVGSLGGIETAAANLRYFDSGTNALVVANPASGTYSRDMCLTIHRKLVVRNNYQVPCHVQVWSCFPKDATSDSVANLYVSGLTDQMITPAASSPLIHLTDSKDVTNVWKCKAVVNRKLMPGQMATGIANNKRFDYTISTNDEQNLAYQKKQGGHIFFVRVVGEVQHDSGGLAEVALGRGGVDWICTATVRFEYDAGKNLHEISLDDNSATGFTTSGVLSAPTVADNQAYEIA